MSTGDPYAESLAGSLAALERQAIAKLKKQVESYTPNVDWASQLAPLKEARRQRQLCLVMGAGMSAPYKIPMWQDLIAALYNTYLPTRDPADLAALQQRYGISAIAFTRFIESHGINPVAFLHNLHRTLYGQFDPSQTDANMDAAARLILSGIEVSITYNFDDILERTLRHRAGGDISSVYKSGHYFAPASGLQVIHPHGFVPFEATDLSEYQDIIFSETRYHAHYLHQYHWANMAQLREFSHKTCLFIGLSFSDPNLRRLLDFSRAFMGRRFQHFVVRRVENESHYAYYFERDMKILGLTTLWVRDYGDIGVLLRDILS